MFIKVYEFMDVNGVSFSKMLTSCLICMVKSRLGASNPYKEKSISRFDLNV